MEWLLKKSNRGKIVMDRVLIGNRIKKTIDRKNLYILKTKALYSIFSIFDSHE